MQARDDRRRPASLSYRGSPAARHANRALSHALRGIARQGPVRPTPMQRTPSRLRMASLSGVAPGFPVRLAPERGHVAASCIGQVRLPVVGFRGASAQRGCDAGREEHSPHGDREDFTHAGSPVALPALVSNRFGRAAAPRQWTRRSLAKPCRRLSPVRQIASGLRTASGGQSDSAPRSRRAGRRSRVRAMRRWNGWGEETIEAHLPDEALGFPS